MSTPRPKQSCLFPVGMSQLHTPVGCLVTLAQTLWLNFSLNPQNLSLTRETDTNKAEQFSKNSLLE